MTQIQDLQNLDVLLITMHTYCFTSVQDFCSGSTDPHPSTD